jgi:hypothetical protein
MKSCVTDGSGNVCESSKGTAGGEKAKQASEGAGTGRAETTADSFLPTKYTNTFAT